MRVLLRNPKRELDVPGPVRVHALLARLELNRESATNTLLTVGAVVLVGVVAIAFLMGRRKGKKRTTVVEVRRI